MRTVTENSFEKGSNYKVTIQWKNGVMSEDIYECTGGYLVNVKDITDSIKISKLPYLQHVTVEEIK